MRCGATLLRLASALAIAILGSCAPNVDAEQASICRRLLPPLLGSQQPFQVIRSDTIKDGEVFVRFTVGGATPDHFIFCRFTGSGLSLRKRELVSIGIDGRTLGESTTFFLKERWLTTHDSVALEPRAPQQPEADVPQVSPAVAYALQQGLSALPKMGIYALMAAAYALLYGLIGRINLTFGAFAALGGILAVLAITVMDILGIPSMPYGLAIGMTGAVTLSAIYGKVLAHLVIVPMTRRSDLQMLVASVSLLIALEEFLRITQGANTRWLSPIYNDPVVLARGGFDVTITPLSVAIAVAAAAVAGLLVALLRYSRFGMEWRAVADEPVAANLFGVSTAYVIGETFALAAALAGLAGTLVAIYYGGIGFAGGTALGLTALVAAILGGIGSVGGALAGGCIIGMVEALWSATMPIEYRDVAVYLLLAVLLALKPAGLFGGREPISMRV